MELQLIYTAYTWPLKKFICDYIFYLRNIPNNRWISALQHSFSNDECCNVLIWSNNELCVCHYNRCDCRCILLIQFTLTFTMYQFKKHLTVAHFIWLLGTALGIPHTIGPLFFLLELYNIGHINLVSDCSQIPLRYIRISDFTKVIMHLRGIWE